MMRTPSMVIDVSAIDVREHNFALACRSRLDRTVLLAAIERAIERREDDVGVVDALGKPLFDAAISPCPGRNASSEPVSARSAFRIASVIWSSRRCVGLRPRYCVSRETPAPRSQSRACPRRGVPPHVRHRASPTSRECAAHPKVPLALERKRQPEIRIQRPLVNSSKRTAPTPVNSGSSRIMRVNTPSVTTSMRVALPTFVESLARMPTVSPTHSPSVAAMRSAALRAASRLGSRMRIFLDFATARRAGPAAHASSYPHRRGDEHRTRPGFEGAEQLGQCRIDRERSVSPRHGAPLNHPRAPVSAALRIAAMLAR